MKGNLNKKAVIIEVVNTDSWIYIKRKKFVQAKIIQCGSEVEHLKKDDIVIAFNEGRTMKDTTKAIRIVNDEAIVMKLAH